MNRFFINKDQITGGKIEFPAAVTHQIVHVLRLGEGDQVEVLDDTGRVFQVRLDSGSADNRLTGAVLETRLADTEPKIQVKLYFGMTSREKVEWILQKGTEVGVRGFCPFISSRTLVQEADLSNRKRERWERIIREAAEQSQRGRLPVLCAPKKLQDCFSEARKTNDLSLFAWEGLGRSGQSTRQALDGFAGQSVGLFVGPEGGFSEAETAAAQAEGCRLVSLGPRIFRMETAAILFPALVLHDLNE